MAERVVNVFDPIGVTGVLYFLPMNAGSHKNFYHFGRKVNYLRLSITDRCNLRCCYCMPAEGVVPCSHKDILSYEDLMQIAKASVDLGIEKVRITGGEPLVRKGIVPFLKRLGAIPGLTEMTLTTNGLLLEENAVRLRKARLNRLNVSLDSLDPQTYAKITRGGDLNRVLKGLKVAEEAGLQLKLNMVVMRGLNEHEVMDFASLSLERPWSIRFIEYMPTIREKTWQSRMVPGREIISRLSQKFDLLPLANTPLCGPAKPFRIHGAKGSIGIITPLSDHFCHDCNRIRVTAQGMAKSCLFSNRTYDLKPALKRGNKALREALNKVIENKAGPHHFEGQGEVVYMSSFGG